MNQSASAEPDELTREVAALADALRQRRLSLAVAEGDTGGLLLAALTAAPGSSAYLLGGIVAYHDLLKEQLLGVPHDALVEYGSVSAEVAEAMAVGTQQVCASLVAIATTGVAGPGGATERKPVGLAYVAVAYEGEVVSERHQWSGDRQANQRASTLAALRLARRALAAGR